MVSVVGLFFCSSSRCTSRCSSSRTQRTGFRCGPRQQMKFEDHLLRHAVPEWRAKYIDYARLKEEIDKIAGELESSHTKGRRLSLAQSETMLTRPCIVRFLQMIDAEATKVNDFYMEIEASATKRLAQLAIQVTHVQPATSVNIFNIRRILGISNAVSPNARSLSTLRAAFEEFYRLLDMLKVFRDLNYTGFRKIMKKFDKNTGLACSDRVMTVMASRPFKTSAVLQSLITRTEKLYIDRIENGDRQRAMRRLRVPEQRFEHVDWSLMRTGFYLGLFSLAAPIIIVAGLFSGSSVSEQPLAMFRMLRGLLLGPLLAFGVGINTYWWSNYLINYPFIFNLDIRNTLSYKALLEFGGMFLVLWAMGALAFFFHSALGIADTTGPIALIATYLGILLLPFNVLKRDSRRWLVRVVCRGLLAPFFAVSFEDFWMMDQLMSMTVMLLDLQFFVCFLSNGHDATDSICVSMTYGIRPIVSCLPAWCRFWQCMRRYHDTKQAFPHLVNAGKYLAYFPVILSSAFAAVTPGVVSPAFIVWIVAATISTAYSMIWDFTIDWSLFRTGAPHRFLRDKLLFPFQFYYFAIVCNVFCRLTFTLNLSVGFFGVWFSDGVVAILAVIEICRRCIWNMLRLENEQINNMEGYRAFREIPLPFEYLSSVDMAFAEDDDP
eukprot:m.152176 g.152176  ORF g.152176 m.152176 type:complete len:663 (+) comp9774_c0_seq10:2653-4641(+)